MNNDTKFNFVLREILTSCMNAAIQRGKVYRPESNSTERLNVRDCISSKLLNLLTQYHRVVDHDLHCMNICDLSDFVSQRHSRVLVGGRFRIGNAQKALNLLLKYLWTLDRIPEPPHCPFDAIVIQQIPSHRNVRWTQLDNIDDYSILVTEANKIAHPRSLSMWELEVWQAHVR